MGNKGVAHSYEIIMIGNNTNNLIIELYFGSARPCACFFHFSSFHFNAGNSNRHECDGFVRLMGEFVHAKHVNVLNLC